MALVVAPPPKSKILSQRPAPGQARLAMLSAPGTVDQVCDLLGGGPMVRPRKAACEADMAPSSPESKSVSSAVLYATQ